MIDKSKLITWDEVMKNLEYEMNRPKTLKDDIIDIYYFFWRIFDKTRIFIKNFPYDLARVFYWFPTIWKDKWFDRNYLFTILEKKLRYDAKRYISYDYAWSVDARKVGDQMLRCAELCKRLREDEYYFVIEEAYKDAGMDIEEMRMELYEKEYKAEKKDLDELFNTMKDNAMGWWD